MHVTLRTVARAPNLRLERIFALVESELARAVKQGARILHFAVQRNHVHLIVEAADRKRLWKALQLLSSRVAHRVNAAVGRTGALWADRYHRRDLTSPSQTRNALVYVMFNERKHALGSARELEINLATLDPFSSAKWFRDWGPIARPPPTRAVASEAVCPLASPRSWLARTGWTRGGGLIRFDEMPKWKP